jgi:hypothetical protein
MKTKLIFLLTFVLIETQAQSITLSPGLGTNLSVRSDLALPRTKRILASTNHVKIGTDKSSAIVFENGGILHSIGEAKDGKLVLILNGNGTSSTAPLTIKHESLAETNVLYRIITPNNGDYLVGNGKGGVLLMYDAAIQRWRVADMEGNGRAEASSTPWKLTGNAGTDPAFNFVGTRDSSVFKINMLDKDILKIDPDGNVGAFTTTDINAKFNINGDLRLGNFSSVLSNTPIVSLNTQGSSRAYINTSGIVKLYGIASPGEGTLLAIYTNSVSSIAINNNSMLANVAERILTHTGTNFTLPPNSGMLLIYSASQWRVFSVAIPEGIVSQNDWRFDANTGTNINTNFIGTTDAVGLKFKTNNKARMEISPAGNVGIGAPPDPDALLLVSKGRSGFTGYPAMKTRFESNDDNQVEIKGLYTGVVFGRPALGANSGGIFAGSNLGGGFYGPTMLLKSKNDKTGIAINSIGVAINKTLPSAALDVNGQVKLQEHRIVINASQSYPILDRAMKSFVSFGGSGTATIEGIQSGTVPADIYGSILYLTSSSGTSIILKHNFSTTITQNIQTTTGSDITISGTGGAILMYDEDGWRVISYTE